MKLKNKYTDKKSVLALKSRPLRTLLFFIIILIANLYPCILNVSSGMLPDLVQEELVPGECYNITTSVEITLIPPKVDVIFAFDLTVSMNDIIEMAKLKAGQIMDTLMNNNSGVSFNFGVMSHMDYPGRYSSCGYSEQYGNSYYGDYAYSLNQSLTNNTADVITAINSLTLGDGGDLPEDYTRIFYESYSDLNIGWRADAKKLLINFADNIPHDCNLNEGVTSGIWTTGSDPGRDAVMGTSDDLDLQSVISSMSSNGITLIECHKTEEYIAFWDYWTGITGGSVYLTSSSNLVDDVVNAVIAGVTAPKIYDLHLELITPGYSSWLTSVVPLSYPEVITGNTVSFVETICVPNDTPEGLYTFIVSAVDEDGVSYGYQTNEINVLVNDPPVISDIPDQSIDKGGSFVTISLDDFVSDVDNSDDELVWTVLGNSDLIVSIDDDRVASIVVPDVDWFGSEFVTFRVADPDGLWDEDIVVFSVSAINDPPNKPKNPSPFNGQIDVELNTVLNWTCEDPENDSLKYDIYFGISSNPPLKVQNQSFYGYSPNLEYSKTYYWKIIAWDVNNESNESDVWSFTTKNAPDGGYSPPVPLQLDPVADASAGSPYYGFVNEDIIFNGSKSYDPDGGSILSWYWTFGDGKTGSGKIIKHNYSTNKTYHVTLKVTDEEGSTNSITFNVIIYKANKPPVNLEVNGILFGKKNIDYTYSANATDLDFNDMLSYIFDWGDGTTTTSYSVASGEIVSVTHNWSSYGEYELTVIAEDNSSVNISKTITVLIDVFIINGDINGYLIDEDSTGPYDIFKNSETGEQTNLEKENNTYLIDSDGDGKWDHTYTLETGLQNYYNYVYQKYYKIFEKENLAPGFEILSLIAALMVVFIILRHRKK